MEQTEARAIAADIMADIALQAFEDMELTEIEEALECSVEDAMSILFEMGGMSLAIYWDEPCEHEIEIGDPDPSAFLGDEYECCLSTNGAWHCTLEVNHGGNHVGGDGFEVCAVWA